MKRIITRESFGFVALVIVLIPQIAHTTYYHVGEMYGHTDNRSIGTYIDKKDVQFLVDQAKAALQNV